MDNTSLKPLKKVQLDEDINAKHIEKACAAEGLVQALRFPKELKGKDDLEVFGALSPKGNVFITTDKGFVSDNLDSFPDIHPGVVIVSFDDDAIPTMTTHAAQKIIVRFKVEFLDWHQIEWKNSVVNICPNQLRVWHVSGGQLIRDLISFRDNDWQMKLAQALGFNATRDEPSM